MRLRLASIATCLGLAAGLALPRQLRAQDSVVVIRPTVPAVDTIPETAIELVRRAIALYNDSSTARMVGSFHLPAGSDHRGPIALFRGNLRVSGRIDGNVTVINGDLIVGPGGEVAGNAFVVGGRILVRDGAILGTQEASEGYASVRRTGSGLLELRPGRRPLGEIAAARTRLTTGRLTTTIGLETGRTYNRVEGLPILFGPTLMAVGPSGVESQLDLRGIFRPATDRTTQRDDLGFIATGEVRGGGTRKWLRLGGSGYRKIKAFEDQPLTLGESGWSSFLLQRDYRDHYEARGVEAYVSVSPFAGLTVRASYREDLERSVPASDPISILRNSESWRANPLIDDGHYRTTTLAIDIDSRNDPVHPQAGWLVHARIEHTTSDDAAPIALPADVRPPLPPGEYGFSTLYFDARRYARFDRSTEASLRVVGGGWIDGDPLPIQRRLSLGGPDLLPGFGFRDMNCGPAGFVDPAQASLCDRMLAVQLEVRRDLDIGVPFRFRSPELLALQQILGIGPPDLVAFADAGKAWLTGDGPSRVPNDRIPNFSEWDVDVGLGIDARGLGLYVAKGLTGHQPVRFVVRLQRRF